MKVTDDVSNGQMGLAAKPRSATSAASVGFSISPLYRYCHSLLVFLFTSPARCPASPDSSKWSDLSLLPRCVHKVHHNYQTP